MSLKKSLQGAGAAFALATSITSHAGDVFERQALKVEEICTGRTSIVLDGKNICEVKSEEVEVSFDGGYTWKPWHNKGIEIGLALSLLGIVWLWRKKYPLPIKVPNRIDPKISTDMPVLIDVLEEPKEPKELIREAILNIKGASINEDFIDYGYTEIITFSILPEKNSAMETNYIFKMLIEKETGKISFHRHIPTFSVMKNDGKWGNATMPEYVTVEMIRNYFESLPILPLYGRKPGE